MGGGKGGMYGGEHEAWITRKCAPGIVVRRTIGWNESCPRLALLTWRDPGSALALARSLARPPWLARPGSLWLALALSLLPSIAAPHPSALAQINPSFHISLPPSLPPTNWITVRHKLCAGTALIYNGTCLASTASVLHWGCAGTKLVMLHMCCSGAALVLHRRDNATALVLYGSYNCTALGLHSFCTCAALVLQCVCTGTTHKYCSGTADALR